LSICVQLQHLTHYCYDRPVRLSPQLIRLCPSPAGLTPLRHYDLRLDPEPGRLVWESDAWGNRCAWAEFTQAVTELRLWVDLSADIALQPIPRAPLEADAAHAPPRYAPGLHAELAPYAARASQPASAELMAYMGDWPRRQGPTLSLLEALNQQVHQDIAYTHRPEPGVQTPEDTLRRRSGSCRDSAWLMVQLLRACGLAARFVSGYLIQLNQDRPGLLATPTVPQDGSELHAWCEVYLPGPGWVGLDTTSGLWTGYGHLALASAPEPNLAAPLTGSVEPCEVELRHEVRLQRLGLGDAAPHLAARPAVKSPATSALAQDLHRPRPTQDSNMGLPFDEMRSGTNAVRPHYQSYADWLDRQSLASMSVRREEAEVIFRRVGITFAVYGEKDEEGAGTERLIPFDLLPRVIPAVEWQAIQRGLVQRVTALNRFIDDVYHGQDILRAGVVPADEVLRNPQFRPEMVGLDVPGGVYAHIAGIDIVRAGQADGSGTYHVLEDNLRVPSGVSYMLENRKMMMRLFPDLFALNRVAPVAHYPDLLLATLRSMAPGGTNDPTVVVLTPGMHNSAYFEHAFLAQQMGVELVEGQDLFVREDRVYMRTTQGPKHVDVIYRRIDDDFLDPQAFRPDSNLGCAGLMRAYRTGNVALCNAIGTGVADDKSIYAYVPQMIEFYLGEKPLLDNVPTWRCREPESLAYVLAHLPKLVVKEVHGAGGYGMLVGPASTQAEIEAFALRIKAHPANYIAQPTLSLSTCPTFVGQGIAPRHIDLRPFVLSGKTVQVVPGGLTRVALKEGSLVVNSSQGGGTKDTWVLDA
jgi:uncharacterized circularly permuted ATP-grasp superfamily protein/transglutaminase-like putative cysteine protease